MNLNQIIIPSLNVEKAIEFYQKLDLKLIVKSLPNYARFECPEGNSTFSIHNAGASVSLVPHTNFYQFPK